MSNKKLHIISNELLQLIGGGGGTVDCKVDVGSTSAGQRTGGSCTVHVPTSKNGAVTVEGGKNPRTGEKYVNVGYKLEF